MDSVGLANLAPRRVFEVVDRTFRVYRENFISFVVLVGVVVVPYQILNYIFNQSESGISANGGPFGAIGNAIRSQDSNLGMICGFFIIGLLYLFLTYVVINSIITYIASENILGRSTSIAEAYTVVSRRFVQLSIAWISSLVFFIIMGVFLVIATVCVVGIVGWPFYFYYIFAIGLFLTPVIVLENVGASLGISRGSALVRSRFWPVFGFFIGMYIIIYMFQGVLGLIVGIFIDVSYSPDAIISPAPRGESALLTGLGTVVSIFTTPLLPIAVTLMYYDTRVRVEGLDIALRSVDTPMPRPRDVASPQPGIRPITGQDILNIIILIMAAIGIVIGLAVLGMVVDAVVS